MFDPVAGVALTGRHEGGEKMVELTRRRLMALAGMAGLMNLGGRALAGLAQDDESVTPMTALNEAEIARLRAYASIPAMGAAHSHRGSQPFLIANGLRSIDAEVPVTVDDLWHIGSNTKSMTSTLVARLIEQGRISWDTTVGDILGPDAPKMQESYKRATFRHLLSHHSGMIRGQMDGMPAANYGDKEPLNPRRDHRIMAIMALEVAPLAPLGEKMLYSNAGYITAAAMIEKVHDRSWQDLIMAEVFEPLKLRTANFGPPGTPGRLDQPLGHVLPEGAAKPVPAVLGDPSRPADLPAVYGPAGLVHMSMRDFITYLNAHLRQPQDFLSADSWRVLHTPPFTENYAMGWIARPDGSIWHNGSNHKWYAEGAVDFTRQSVACAMSNGGNMPRVKLAIAELLRTSLNTAV